MMKLIRPVFFVLTFLAAVSIAFSVDVRAAEDGSPLRVLLVTGGHWYDQEGLHKMILDHPNTEMDELVLPEGEDQLDAGISQRYDVLVFHDQSSFELTDAQKEKLAAMWEEGVPTVMLHHALISHNDFPLFREVYGTAYLTAPMEIDGTTYPASSYIQPADVNFIVVDHDHPITQGLKDFTLTDEVFGDLWLAPEGNHVLIRTDHPDSSEPICWTRQYKNSPVFVLIQGHDKGAFNDPRYREIFYRGLDWVSGKASR
ncbi:MAG: ThuA domain-containing protein [Thermoguttaceae bacterium]|nr:ThuA domain-containing protein [Thermoguttaceae bacterium]